MRKALDTVDIKLLDCLQKNNLQTAEQLAEQVGRSPSVVARRLRRLRTSGAVAADTASISDQITRNPIFAVVHVQLERHLDQAADILRRQFVADPHVQLYLEISGTFDIMLLVVAADMDAYNDFADILLAQQGAVRRFETTFVKKRGKATLAVPLEEFAHRHRLVSR